MTRFDAILFDAGGVLVLPDPTVVAPLLAYYGADDSIDAHRRAHYAGIIRLLGALRPAPAGEPSDLGACARRLRGDASVIVFGDFLAADEMRRDLAALLERCTSLHALQVGQASETALTVVGEADLVDVETGERLAARRDATAATVAAAERAAMTRRLRDFCDRSGIAFTAWDVQRPWQQTLIEHLARARSAC